MGAISTDRAVPCLDACALVVRCQASLLQAVGERAARELDSGTAQCIHAVAPVVCHSLSKVHRSFIVHRHTLQAVPLEGAP